MSQPRRLTVVCPDCAGRLTVDAATGEVIGHTPAERPVAGGHDFDTLLAGLDRDKQEAEEVFEREVAAHKDRARLLEEKFEEAMKRAEDEDDGSPPPRPFDFD